jgi:hypothetical protein
MERFFKVFLGGADPMGLSAIEVAPYKERYVIFFSFPFEMLNCSLFM